MNQRIRELYYQCQDEGLSTEECYQNFAELIIRECIEQARSVGDLRGVNDDMIYGADYAGVQISKHFGVEE